MVGIVPKFDWYSKAKTKAYLLVWNSKIEKTGWQNNALDTYKFTNTEQRYFSKFLKQEYGAVGPGAIK